MKYKAYITLILLSLIFPTVSFSSSSGAKVIILRGEISFTLPNSNKKMSPKRGDQIPEGATITTYPKSMVKLLYRDKTTSTIGPRSILKLTQETLPRLSKSAYVAT